MGSAARSPPGWSSFVSWGSRSGTRTAADQPHGYRFLSRYLKDYYMMAQEIFSELCEALPMKELKLSCACCWRKIVDIDL